MEVNSKLTGSVETHEISTKMGDDEFKMTVQVDKLTGRISLSKPRPSVNQQYIWNNSNPIVLEAFVACATEALRIAKEVTQKAV